VTYPDGGQAVPQGGEAGEEDGALGPRRDGRQERLQSDAPGQLWTASFAGRKAYLDARSRVTPTTVLLHSG
jgi:hypothetical protein